MQRIVNGGGRIEREYGLGRMRTDLLILWPLANGLSPSPLARAQRIVIEVKLMHQSLSRTIDEGLAQTWAYMDRCGAHEGHLVIFDRRQERSWEKKIFTYTKRYAETPIEVWGM